MPRNNFKTLCQLWICTNQTQNLVYQIFVIFCCKLEGKIVNFTHAQISLYTLVML
jgi:hypothetical protein